MVFERSFSELTLYLKREGEIDFLVVCLYVDDMTNVGLSEFVIAEFKACMVKKFEMSDLGLLHYFIGLELKQAGDGILFHKENI